MKIRKVTNYIMLCMVISMLALPVSNAVAFGISESSQGPQNQQTSTSNPAPAEPQDTSVTIEELQNQVEKVYADTHSSVVNITSKVLTPGIFNMAVPQEGAGSGFLFDDEGHIVTNYHVIHNAESITVSCGDGSMYEAEVVGKDPFTDLAVLKIEQDDLPKPLPLGNSDELNVGEFVIAVGNPFSFEQTMTFGVISALGRVIKSSRGGFISEAIQTDTPINPGNSGGPLVDKRRDPCSYYL